VQTFLPYPDFVQTAKVLDNSRLGKQRVETYQILQTIAGYSRGWRGHPAVQMWVGHAPCLAWYGVVICDEWIRRGYQDNLRLRIASHLGPDRTPPWWLGDERMHSGHRARLLMKKPEWYSQFGWLEKPSEDYWWPTRS